MDPNKRFTERKTMYLHNDAITSLLRALVEDLWAEVVPKKLRETAILYQGRIVATMRKDGKTYELSAPWIPLDYIRHGATVTWEERVLRPNTGDWDSVLHGLKGAPDGQFLHKVSWVEPGEAWGERHLDAFGVAQNGKFSKILGTSWEGSDFRGNVRYEAWKEECPIRSAELPYVGTYLTIDGARSKEWSSCPEDASLFQRGKLLCRVVGRRLGRDEHDGYFDRRDWPPVEFFREDNWVKGETSWTWEVNRVKEATLQGGE